MTIERAILNRLNTHPDYSALVSKTYANLAPKKAVEPAVVYQMISEVPFDSTLEGDHGITRSRVQFRIIAASSGSRRAVTDALANALKRYRGTHSGVEFLDIRLEDMFDADWDEDTDQTDRLIDYMFYHKPGV